MNGVAVNMLAESNLMWGPLILLFVFLIILIKKLLQIFQKRKRSSRQYWMCSGFDSYFVKDELFSEKYAQFACFRQGYFSYAENILSGMWRGYKTLFFDYYYTIDPESSRPNRRFSGVLMHSSLAARPLLIRPERFLDKAVAMTGLEDINFESAEFSREFYVQADNRKWAYDVLHARAMEFLLAQPRYIIEIRSCWMLITRGRHIFTPQHFEGAANLGAGVLNMIPEYMKDINNV